MLDPVEEILFERPWKDVGYCYYLRSLSYTFANIRILYNGPLGYESEDKFIRGDHDNPGGILRALNTSLILGGINSFIVTAHPILVAA